MSEHERQSRGRKKPQASFHCREIVQEVLAQITWYHNLALLENYRDPDMAAQIFKDPYLFDFLGTADTRKEREIEQALADHVQKFLLELGAGFAFVGLQVLLEGGDE